MVEQAAKPEAEEPEASEFVGPVLGNEEEEGPDVGPVPPKAKRRRVRIVQDAHAATW